MSDSSLRYCIVNDDSCHYYLIPYDRKPEWDAWEASLPTDCSDIPDEVYDLIDWNPPAFAKRIDGWHRLSFIAPKEE